MTIGSENGCRRRDAIVWTNAGILLNEPLGTNFSEIKILFEICKFSCKNFIRKCRQQNGDHFVQNSMCKLKKLVEGKIVYCKVSDIICRQLIVCMRTNTVWSPFWISRPARTLVTALCVCAYLCAVVCATQLAFVHIWNTNDHHHISTKGISTLATIKVLRGLVGSWQSF